MKNNRAVLFIAVVSILMINKELFCPEQKNEDTAQQMSREEKLQYLRKDLKSNNSQNQKGITPFSHLQAAFDAGQTKAANALESGNQQFNDFNDFKNKVNLKNNFTDPALKAQFEMGSRTAFNNQNNHTSKKTNPETSVTKTDSVTSCDAKERKTIRINKAAQATTDQPTLLDKENAYNSGVTETLEALKSSLQTFKSYEDFKEKTSLENKYTDSILRAQFELGSRKTFYQQNTMSKASSVNQENSGISIEVALSIPIIIGISMGLIYQYVRLERIKNYLKNLFKKNNPVKSINYEQPLKSRFINIFSPETITRRNLNGGRITHI